MVMAVFAYIYHQSFVVPQGFSVEMILDQVKGDHVSASPFSPIYGSKRTHFRYSFLGRYWRVLVWRSSKRSVWSWGKFL